MLKILIPIFIIFYSVSSAFAHPHVFIDANINLRINDNQIKYITTTWYFDRMYSSNIMSEFDKNKNGQIDKAELPSVKKEAFDNLKNYDYMLHISLNKRKIKINRAKDFNAYIVDKKIIYSFRIPINRKLLSIKSATLAIYDKTSFCDFQLTKKNPVNISGQQNSVGSVQIKRVSYKAEYVTPQEIRIKFN